MWFKVLILTMDACDKVNLSSKTEISSKTGIARKLGSQAKLGFHAKLRLQSNWDCGLTGPVWARVH